MTLMKIGISVLVLNIMLFLVFRFWFFMRDPQRIIPEGDNIVSPADGKIVYIRKIADNKVPLSIKKGRKYNLQDLYPGLEDINFKYVIGIYMTEVSVHVNRSPIAGTVKESVVQEGPNYSMVRLMMNIIFRLSPYEQKSICNVINTRRITLIEGKFSLALVQIADKWVNRIDFYKENNDVVKKGERVGMIRMGSQCDILLPDIEGLQFKVEEGDWVKGGCDIIAEYC